MANRMFYKDAMQLERRTVTLFAKITMASGAPVLSATQSKGCKSVTLTATGRMTFVLTDPYKALLFAEATPVDSASAPAIATVCVRSETVATSSNPTVVLSFLNSSLAEATPADGKAFLLRFVLQNH